MRKLLAGLFFYFSLASLAIAAENTLNLYVWGGEIPDSIIKNFEKSSGVKVNVATYENNETMFAKLKANPYSQYDLILPSSYFVDKMQQQGMLAELDKSKLSNWKNLDPYFLNAPYDPQSKYALPYLWGTSIIFTNKKFYSGKRITSWSSLWNHRFDNQLMLLDDMREVFSVALLTLGYSVNDNNPQHIKQAYEKLRKLLTNVKVMASETTISIIIDEDVRIGMAWNGDINKAQSENAAIQGIYPREGYVIWADCFAIPKHAPHKEAAHQFLNYIIEPSVGKNIAELTGYPTTNTASRKLMPKEVRENKLIYPSKATLKRGQFQKSVDDQTMALYTKYWELLKLGY